MGTCPQSLPSSKGESRVLTVGCRLAVEDRRSNAIHRTHGVPFHGPFVCPACNTAVAYNLAVHVQLVQSDRPLEAAGARGAPLVRAAQGSLLMLLAYPQNAFAQWRRTAGSTARCL